MDENGIATLVAALASSVASDAQARAQADAFLAAASTQNGTAFALLRIAADDGLDMGVRQSASIYFKNMCAKSWAAREHLPTAWVMSASDKANARGAALDAIARTPAKVRSQLVEAVRVMVHHDFPEQWPEVASQVLQGLEEANAAHPERLCGTVLVLHALCRKYEFKHSSERADIEQVIAVVFPKLLSVLKALIAYGTPNEALEELKKTICKTYWSATYLHVGPSLQQEDTYREWMSAFHTVITTPVHIEGISDPTDKMELRHWPWWKTKKWALHIVNRQFTRYGNLKNAQSDSKELAAMYRKSYATQFLQCYVELLSSLTTGMAMPNRVVNLAVTHLSSALSVTLTYKVLHPHLDDIAMRVMFPLVCFGAEDKELWEDDPNEYVRKSQDFMEDMYSPRMAALNYLSESCKTGSRMKENLPKILAAMVQILNKAAAFPPGTALDPQLASEVDGALLVITNLSEILAAHPMYKHQLESMLVSYVIPSFSSPHGHVRAKAVSCAAKYCEIEFENPQNFFSLFSCVVNAMKDPELPVRVEAVVGLGAFVHAADEVSQLKPILPQLLNEFFQLMNEVDSEDVVFTLETITEKFGEEIAPYALGMTQNLVAAFWKVIEESESKDDEDYGALACCGCLRAMATILESISSLPHMYPDLEAAVFPILQKMIGEQGYDVFEEILEILSYLTYFTPVVTPRMWELWPLMIKTMDDWALQYFENLLIPLDNYISRGTERFLTPGTPYVEDTYNICKKVLEGDYPEPDCLSAPKLMECVMTNCRGRVDVVIEPYINIALARLATAENSYFRDLLMMTFAHALHYNASLALMATNRSGKTNEVFALWSSMLNERTKSGERKRFTTESSKKVCALGLMALLRAPAEVLTPEIHGALGGILATLLDLLGSLREQITSRKADEASGVRRRPWELSDEEEYDEPDFDDEDQDEDLQFDETTLRALAKNAKDADPHAARYNDDDDDDDFDFFADDDECTSPLDDIDTFITFSDFLNELGSMGDRAGALQAIQSQADANAKVQNLMQYVEVRRVEFPKEREEAKSK